MVVVTKGDPSQGVETLIQVITPPPTRPPTPTKDPLAYLATPTYTPKEQVALETALAHFGDKAVNLKAISISIGGASPKYVVRLQQTYKGIPIKNARLRVYFDKDQLPQVEGRYYDDVELETITPPISLSEAITIAATHVNLENYDYITESGTQLFIAVSSSGKKKDIHHYHLRWQVVLQSFCPFEGWVVQLDPFTGDVLSSVQKEGPKIPGTKRATDC